MIASLLPLVALVGAAAIFVKPFLGLFLLALFAQLEGLLEFFGQGIPMMKALAAATLVGTVLGFCHEPKTDRLTLHEGTTRWAVAFLIAIILSALLADDTGRAFDTVRRLVTLILLYYMTVKLCTSPERISLVILGVMLSTIVTSLVIIYDKWFAGGLLDVYNLTLTVGTDRDEDASTYTAAASYVLTGTALSAWLFLHSSRLRLLTGVVFLAGTAGLIFSLSRSSFIGYAIGALWLLWKFRRSRHFGAALVTCVAIAGAVLAALPEAFVERLSAFSPEGPEDWTLDRRWGYHIIGMELLASHPFLGVGPGNYPLHYIGVEHRWEPGHTFEYRSLHNMYLGTLSETGLVGGFFLFGFLLASLYRCWSFVKQGIRSELSVYGQALLFAMTLYLVVSFTLPNLVSKYIWLFAGLAVAVGRVGDQHGGRAPAVEATAKRPTSTPGSNRWASHESPS